MIEKQEELHNPDFNCVQFEAVRNKFHTNMENYSAVLEEGNAQSERLVLLHNRGT